MGIEGTWLEGWQEPDFRGATAAERRGGTFRRYLPARLAARDVGVFLSRDVREEALEAASLISTTSALVDEGTRRGIYPLLLRSESIASSQIERIHASPRDVSFAQLGAGVTHLRNHQAMAVARNVEATRRAIETFARRKTWSASDIEDIHAALGVVGARSGLRGVDVWIGGRDRLRAEYVAPPPEHVRALVEDLCRYLNTSGEHPLILAALAHAQFETVHPFEDGNGRVGRAMVHAVLERGGIVRSGVLPISTAIRSREREYVRLLMATRVDNADHAAAALNDWMRFFTAAAVDACVLVRQVQGAVREMDAVLEEKARGLRSDAAARRILPVLREQPVVTAAFVAEHLGVSPVAAHRAVNTLVERTILVPGTGRYRRSEVFQAPDVLAVLDDAI